MMKRSFAAKFADKFGLLFFLAGMGVLLVAAKSEAFKWVADEHAGVEFLRRYLDYPVFGKLAALLPENSDDTFVLVSTILIHGLISCVYGFLAYVVVKLLTIGRPK